MVDIREWIRGKSSTEKLYLFDSYLRTCTARLEDYVREKGSKYYVILDKTIFHPRGGGQPSDTGLLFSTSFKFGVRKVIDVGGVVVHYGRLVEGRLEKDVPVKCVIDWERRYKVMRLHTAGHILDYAVYRVYGRVVETLDAFHGPPRPYIAYRARPPEPREVEEIERIANSVVEEAIPVEIVFAKPGELERRILNAPNIGRLPPAVSRYRIVATRGVNAIPCTGTHVRNTREVGKIIVKEVEPMEDDSFKLYYDVK